MLGIAITASPLAVCSAGVMGVIVALAGRGLESRERKLVQTLLCVAIAARLAMIAGLFVYSLYSGQPVTSFWFDGDGVFMKRRSLWIRSFWSGVPLDPSLFRLTYDRYGWSSYVQVIAYLQYLLGEAPFAVHFFNISCYLAAAALLHRTVRHAYGAAASLVALVVTLFMPTLFCWSLSALKESLYFLLTVGVVSGSVTFLQRTGLVWRLGGIGMVTGATVALGGIRAGAFVFVGGTLGLALAGTFLTRRLYLLGVAVLLVWFLGGRLIETPQVQSRLMPLLVESATLHTGHVRTEGHGYKLLDERLYLPGALESMTWPEAQRFLARAVWSFAVAPLPWTIETHSELLFVPQQLIWYSLLILAVPGVVTGIRRDACLTWMLIGLICSAAAVIAPNMGNVGTLVRFRDTVVPFVACLGALGAVSVLKRITPGNFGGAASA
ncbi:MAG: hypothetical protein AB1806_06715 [Acidobacteriota bacterium]